MPTRRVDAAKNVRANADDSSVAELLIFDVIGRDFWGEGIDATGVVNFLTEQDDDAEIHVRINSPGGDAFEGTAIYNVLAQDSRRVVVHIDGLAASVASLIAMAGDEIHMAENALFMIHGASGLTIGTAADHEDMAKLLHKINTAMALTYAKRSGADFDDVSDWMDEETWMNADEAHERGFVNVVSGAKKAEASWGRRGQQVVASFRKGSQHLSPVPQVRPQQIAAQATKEPTMDLSKICAALGLPEDAQPDTITAAIDARNDELEKLSADITAATSTEPDPRKYASREDLDKVRARADALDARLRDRDLEDLLVKAEGKLVFSDSDRDRYRKFVREGGMTLAALREEIENKPKSPLATADEITARGSQNDTGLTDAEISLCKTTGLDQKRYADTKAKRARKLEVA